MRCSPFPVFIALLLSSLCCYPSSGMGAELLTSVFQSEKARKEFDEPVRPIIDPELERLWDIAFHSSSEYKEFREKYVTGYPDESVATKLMDRFLQLLIVSRAVSIHESNSVMIGWPLRGPGRDVDIKDVKDEVQFQFIELDLMLNAKAELLKAAFNNYSRAVSRLASAGLLSPQDLQAFARKEEYREALVGICGATSIDDLDKQLISNQQVSK